jgi:hypothetical protein
MAEETRDFVAEIVAGRGGGAFVEIPFSVKELWGTGGLRDRRAEKAPTMVLVGKAP